MTRNRGLLVLLAVSAVADWLLNRVVTRVGIFIPKSPVMVQAYELAGIAGRFAGLLTALLAIAYMAGMAVHSLRLRQFAWASALGLVGLLSLWFLFVVPVGWGPQMAHALTILLMAGFAARLTRRKRIGFALLASSALMGELYLSLPGIYQTAGLAGPPPSLTFYALGEALAVAGAITLAWECRRAASRRNHALSLAAAAAFAAAFVANPSLTGILVIWSTGYSLYLPAFLYVLAVYGLALALFSPAEDRPENAVALALILTGGFAPQLSPQRMLALAAFWLASRSDARPTAPEKAGQLGAAPLGVETETHGAA
jgi:hypothetical protein